LLFPLVKLIRVFVNKAVIVFLPLKHGLGPVTLRGGYVAEIFLNQRVAQLAGFPEHRTATGLGEIRHKGRDHYLAARDRLLMLIGHQVAALPRAQPT
jgi:hypothetical protein